MPIWQPASVSAVGRVKPTTLTERLQARGLAPPCSADENCLPMWFAFQTEDSRAHYIWKGGAGSAGASAGC
jgi:hypothetical protein